MSPDQKQQKIELEEYLKTLSQGKEREFVAKVLEELSRFEKMSDEEIDEELKKASEAADFAEHQIKLLEMSEAERKEELERLQAKAKKERESAEKEYEAAIESAAGVLIDEDLKRRKAETEAIKTVVAEKTADLIENFKIFLAKSDLVGCGVVFKKLAASGRVGEILNYYGYSSNASGLHRFFNEIMIGQKPIVGEQAFDNFLLQQKAYSIEHEISCLAGGLNQWSLAFVMGRKKRAWYQLEEKEHLLAVVQVIKKVKPEVAARVFGVQAYGAFVPREKFNLAAGFDFELGREGKLILMMFADIFEKQLAKKEFNPEAAIVLRNNLDEIETIGVRVSFVEALAKYVDSLKIKPEKAETVEEEFDK